MIRRLALALALLPGAALSDPPAALAPRPDLGPPLTAQQFDSYSLGKTLSYAQDGLVWGSEQYLPGRQVLWAFTDQHCEFGQWYEDQGAICFVYEGKTEANCWYFYQGPSGLIARFISGTSYLSEVGQTPDPLNCPGPQVGA